MPVLGRAEDSSLKESFPEKGRTADRNLTIFKSLLLTLLMALTLYGMLNRGLF